MERLRPSVLLKGTGAAEMQPIARGRPTTEGPDCSGMVSYEHTTYPLMQEHIAKKCFRDTNHSNDIRVNQAWLLSRKHFTLSMAQGVILKETELKRRVRSFTV